MSTEATDFSLPNVGPGPDPLSLSALSADNEFGLLLFQRDHYCTNCRKQVQTVAEWYDEFADRETEVVSIVPEPPTTVREWQDSYDLPYPLVADPETEAGDAYHQPVRFGLLGDWSDFLGRMPEAVLVDLGETPETVWQYRSTSTFDRPDVDDLLAAIDDARGA
ncbi:peroxiredoxin [Halobacteriales archaeon QH_8_67_36]|nr:MAG: peroxiredoxin [Halobacteriales archaeon QH_8_67_36]